MFIAPPWHYNKENAGFNQLLLLEDFSSSVCYTQCMFPQGKCVTVCPFVVCGHLSMVSSAVSLSKPNSSKFTVKADSCCSLVTSDGFSYKSVRTFLWDVMSHWRIGFKSGHFNVNYLKSGQSKVHFGHCRQSLYLWHSSQMNLLLLLIQPEVCLNLVLDFVILSFPSLRRTCGRGNIKISK